MKRIESAIRDVCECSDLQIQPEAPLRDIEGWDSMRAVTFQVEMERIFSVDLSGEMITGNHTLMDVAEILRRKGVELGPLSPVPSHGPVV